MEELAMKLKDRFGSHAAVCKLLGVSERTYYNLRTRNYKNPFLLTGLEAKMRKLLRNHTGASPKTETGA